VIILFITLLAFSAFFSGTETAFFSLDKVKYHQIMAMRTKTAEKVIKLAGKPEKLIISIIIGNTFVNIAASSIMANIFFEHYGEKGIALSIIVMMIVVLIFGEVTPKQFALAFPKQYSLMVAYPISFFAFIFSPFRKIIDFVAKGFVKTLGLNIKPSKLTVTEQEIKNLFSIGEQQGVVKEKERDMVDNILSLKELNAADIMTPRIDLSALDMSESRDKIIVKVKDGQYSRIPVYVHTLDNIVGIIHTKDFLMDPSKPIQPLIERPLFVPESMRADNILHELQKRKLHIAVVTDEYGVTSGVVTVEDILEEIVGEIRDELDFEEEEIKMLDKNTYEVNGQVHINEVNEAIGMEIDTDEVDTIGGYVMLKLGKIPQAGDILELKGYVITVGDVSKNRITSLKIKTTDSSL
jgi:magnesium and cobalt exporter, CNNM family